MDLEQALTSALQILEAIKTKAQEMGRQLADINNTQQELIARAKAITERENAIGPMEDIKKVLVQSAKIREELDLDRKALEKDRSDFSNEMTIANQKLQEEEARLHPLREQAEQVRRDKISLEAEKKLYKEKIRTELLNQLKSGKV